MTTRPTPPDGELRRFTLAVCDTDQGENPLSWSDPAPDPDGPAGPDTLLAALRAVRRQCADWTTPSGAVTWNSKVRDRSVANAAGLLLDLIDRLVPGLATTQHHDEDQDQDGNQCASRAARFATSPAGLGETPRPAKDTAAIARLLAWVDELDERARALAGPEAAHPVAATVRHLIAADAYPPAEDPLC